MSEITRLQRIEVLKRAAHEYDEMVAAVTPICEIPRHSVNRQNFKNGAWFGYCIALGLDPDEERVKG